MLSSAISDSAIESRCLTKARRELPWAATMTVLPDLSCGAMVSLKKGRTRSRVVLRDSVNSSGKETEEYFFSLLGCHSEERSTTGGGTS